MFDNMGIYNAHLKKWIIKSIVIVQAAILLLMISKLISDQWF